MFIHQTVRRNRSEFKIKFQFLPPHTRNGCNCDDVRRIVQLLREMGNDSIYGLVDYDNTNDDDEYIFVIGGKKRYAIDSYIFDPIYVYFLLIREGLIKTGDLGIGNYTFTKLGQLSQEKIQQIINYISIELGLDSDKKISYSTIGGETFFVSVDYFKIQGHLLEEKIMNKWPQLNAIKKGKNDESIMKTYVLDKVIMEYPEHLSIDFIDTFNKIS